MSHTPHDALFKAVFSQPSLAMEELRAVIAPELVRHLDLPSAELVSGSFVEEALQQRHADLLFRVTFAGREAFAYLLFEHQSEPDPLMPYRLVRYMTRIWERWLGEHAGATRLPAILPLVLSHSPRGWTAPRTLGALYDLAPAARVDFGRWLPDFELVVDDLAAQPDDALRARATDALARLVMLMLKHSRTGEDLAALLLNWGALIEKIVQAPSGVSAFGLVVSYLLSVREVDRTELGRLLELSVGPKAKEAVMTTGEQLREEGRQEGRQEGRREGRQEGRQEGLQAMKRTLLRLLERRFGKPGPEVVQRVEAAGTQDYERWTERLLTAPTLAAVFGDSE